MLLGDVVSVKSRVPIGPITTVYWQPIKSDNNLPLIEQKRKKIDTFN